MLTTVQYDVFQLTHFVKDQLEIITNSFCICCIIESILNPLIKHLPKVDPLPCMKTETCICAVQEWPVKGNSSLEPNCLV